MPAAMMRPDSGTMARTANKTDVNKCINDLQQELIKSKAETQRARDKLNCLISLIRRSWNGDRNALLHLSNIVGMEAPGGGRDGTEGRPSSMMLHAENVRQTRAEKNWERLTIRLLQMENEMLQQEIRKHQQRYIENRSRFMDEVLLSHQKDMARTPGVLQYPPSRQPNTLEELDRQFLQQHRPPVRRAKSAAQARSKPPRDTVQVADVKLRELFVDSTNPPLAGDGTAEVDACRSMTGLAPAVKEKVRKVRPHETYDDTRRYLHVTQILPPPDHKKRLSIWRNSTGNLFNAEEMLSRKPRPMSAAIQRERDAQRARPRSASFTKSATTVFLTQTEGRPMTLESVRPVSAKKPLRRRSSDKTGDAPHVTFVDQSSVETPSGEQAETEKFVLPEETVEDILAAANPPKPPISIHMKSNLKRPEGVDRLTDDLRRMENMEMIFQRDTKALQRRIGLPEDGIV